MSNIIVFLPSGEVYNCSNYDRYDIFVIGFAKYKEYVNQIEINEYVSNDDLKDDIYNIIKSNIKLNIEIKHVKYGNGKLQGIIDDNAFIIDYGQGKKVYTKTDELIKDLNYSFI